MTGEATRAKLGPPQEEFAKEVKARILATLVICTVALTVSCGLLGRGPAIENGSAVSIHYVLKVEGEVVDRSAKESPLEYIQGSREIIPGLEDALVGLRAGAKRVVVIPPDKAYGGVDPEATRKVPVEEFDSLEELKIGDTVQGGGEGKGGRFHARIKQIGEHEVTLDLNHPLAGKTLEFEVEVLSVGPSGTPRPPGATGK